MSTLSFWEETFVACESVSFSQTDLGVMRAHDKLTVRVASYARCLEDSNVDPATIRTSRSMTTVIDGHGNNACVCVTALVTYLAVEPVDRGSAASTEVRVPTHRNRVIQ